MAQDFGDDIGNALIQFVARQAENFFRPGPGGESRASEWWERHFSQDGVSQENVGQMASEKVARESVIAPIGTAEEASYYAQVCREHGIYAAAYADGAGNGFLSFAREDSASVADLAKDFRAVMSALDAQRISDRLSTARPLAPEDLQGLTEQTHYPDLPAEDVTIVPATVQEPGKKPCDVLFCEQSTEGLHVADTVYRDGYTKERLASLVGKQTRDGFQVLSVGEPYRVHATYAKRDEPEPPYRESPHSKALSPEDIAIHTKQIRDAAEVARDSCSDFADFERRLNLAGYGVTESRKGEVMLYEPASLAPDGTVPDFEHGRDWPVSAATLKKKWDLDVTHAWFEGNMPRPLHRDGQERTQEPRATDGSLDEDGSTPDLNQGIESHDGRDTNTATAVMDAEQTGSVVPPSEIRREEQAARSAAPYDLASEVKDMRAAQAALLTGRGGSALEHGLSDLMQPTETR